MDAAAAQALQASIGYVFHNAGLLQEAFGVGTAAVISPIGELNIFGKKYVLGEGGIGPLSQKLYDYLTDIQWGRVPDPYGWVVPVED
mgnify:CR=1 FL=1